MIKKTAQTLNSEYQKYLRVWRLLRKPTMEEFKTVSKVTAVGLLLIGALGFLTSIILEMIKAAV